MKYIWIFSFLFSQLAWSDKDNSKNGAKQSICQFLVEGDYPIGVLVEGDRSAFIKFASALARCSIGDRSALTSFEGIHLHRCYSDDPSTTALIVHSNPNQQEVCSLSNMEPSELPPIKLHYCLDEDGNISKIVYSALSKEKVCGQSLDGRITLSEEDTILRPTTAAFVKTTSVDGSNNPIDCFVAPGDVFRIAGLLDDVSTQKTTEIAIIKVTEGIFREMNCPINNYIAVPVECERNPSQPGTPFSANCDPKLLEQFFGVGFSVN